MSRQLQNNSRQRSSRTNQVILDEDDDADDTLDDHDDFLSPSNVSSPTESLPSSSMLSTTEFGENLNLDDDDEKRDFRAAQSDFDGDSGLDGDSRLDGDFAFDGAVQSDADGECMRRDEVEDNVEVNVSSTSGDDENDETLHSNASPTSFHAAVDGEDAISFDSASREVSLPDFSSNVDDASTTSSRVSGDDRRVSRSRSRNTAATAATTPSFSSYDDASIISLPDLTSPEPALRVTGSEVRRAASLLRRKEGVEDDDAKLRRRRRRRSLAEGEEVEENDVRSGRGGMEERRRSGNEYGAGSVDQYLKAPTSDYSTFSRSSSPASGALRQISQRLCDSVTSLDSVSSSSSSLQHQKQHRSHRPRFSHHKRQKVEKILTTLSSDPSDVSAVRQLAISRSGLVSNDVRALAWPKLLNVYPNRKLRRRSWDELTLHRDYNQVVLDVRRSLRRFPPGLTQEEQELLQVKLNTLILRVLCEHQELHYYQGYHDICVTFLLAVGEDLAFALMDRLSTHHLRDFMDSTMERTTHLLNYLLPLVGRVNPALRDYVEAAGVGTVFSLSWLITWYGHVLNELKNIVRLYDFFLACHPLMPLYLAAAIVIHRERDILDTECDFAMLHCTLSKVPEDLPWETLISNAGDYFIQFPPSELAAEAEWIYQKGVTARESRIAAASSSRQGGRGAAVARGRGGGGKLMTRNKDGAWIPLEQPKRVAARIVMWTFYASMGAAAYAVYTAGGFSWLWSGS